LGNGDSGGRGNGTGEEGGGQAQKEVGEIIRAY